MIQERRSPTNLHFLRISLGRFLLWFVVITTSFFLSLKWLDHQFPVAVQMGLPLLVSGPVAAFPVFRIGTVFAGIVVGFLFVLLVDPLVFYLEGGDAGFALTKWGYLTTAFSAGGLVQITQIFQALLEEKMIQNGEKPR